MRYFMKCFVLRTAKIKKIYSTSESVSSEHQRTKWVIFWYAYRGSWTRTKRRMSCHNVLPFAWRTKIATSFMDRTCSQSENNGDYRVTVGICDAPSRSKLTSVDVDESACYRAIEIAVPCTMCVTEMTIEVPLNDTKNNSIRRGPLHNWNN